MKPSKIAISSTITKLTTKQALELVRQEFAQSDWNIGAYGARNQNLRHSGADMKDNIAHKAEKEETR